MYILITEDLVRIAFGEHALSGAAKRILHQLDTAVQHGVHYVKAQAKALVILEQQPGYEYLKSLSGRIIDKPRFKWHAEFDTSNIGRDDVHQICHLNIDDDSIEMYHKTYLLCEHPSDCSFYALLLYAYQSYLSIENPNAWDSIMGGGGALSTTYRDKVLEKATFVLCLCDSDKHYPTDNLGSTPQQVVDVDHKIQSPYGKYYHMNEVCEIENLIPFKLLQRYYVDQKAESEKQRFKDIEKIYVNNQDYLNYFDYKLGITLHSLDRDLPNSNCLEIADIVDPSIRAKYPVDLANITKEEDRRKKEYVRGLGEKLLVNLLKYINENKINLGNYMRDLSPAQSSEYLQLGAIINDWTCAAEPKYTI